MALEAVVYQKDFLSYNGSKDINSWGSSAGPYEICGLVNEDNDKGDCCSFDDQYFLENQTESILNAGAYNWNNPTSSSPPTMVLPNFNEFYSEEDANANNVSSIVGSDHHPLTHQMDTSSSDRPKRRRAKTRKNQEEIENQRMTHIAVERNRRKQMNEYLSALRSLMPDSYVQRGDQASIIGGAINFVRELEHKLQSLGAQKEVKEKSENGSSLECSPFAEYFIFPQYSTSSIRSESEALLSHETQNSITDIEVNMVESHANLKIRSERRPKQLLKMVSGLHSMRLTVLHLNVTTADEIVLYSLIVKVEDDCNLTSGDDIATAVYQLLGRIQEDALC